MAGREGSRVGVILVTPRPRPAGGKAPGQHGGFVVAVKQERGEGPRAGEKGSQEEEVRVLPLQQGRPRGPAPNLEAPPKTRFEFLEPPPTAPISSGSRERPHPTRARCHAPNRLTASEPRPRPMPVVVLPTPRARPLPASLGAAPSLPRSHAHSPANHLPGLCSLSSKSDALPWSGNPSNTQVRMPGRVIPPVLPGFPTRPGPSSSPRPRSPRPFSAEPRPCPPGPSQ